MPIQSQLAATVSSAYREKIGPEVRKYQGKRGKRMNAIKEKDVHEEGRKGTEDLMYKILSKENMERAYYKVLQNKGAAGSDGIGIEEFPEYVKERWDKAKRALTEGRYRPKAIRRVEIPKPNGGKRKLGIPSLMDRMIQQAVLQVISPIFEAKFSEHSYGFRPGRKAHDALEQARIYQEDGYVYTVDIDLAKFFDEVNHDKLMGKVMRHTPGERRLHKLIRKMLQTGILENGVQVRAEKGTPQGGPLSPLLANIVLDDLDKELERRGHRFCRYADDCNTYVRTRKAAERVKVGIVEYIETQLKLKVNHEKSGTGKATERKFLGMSFYNKPEGKIGIRVAEVSKERIKKKVQWLTARNRGWSMGRRIESLNQVTRGWIQYYRISDMKGLMEEIGAHTRRRLRMCYWKQWKRIRTKYKELRKHGYSHQKSYEYANTRKGCWRISGSWILTKIFTNEYFEEEGLVNSSKYYAKLRST